MLPSPVVAGAHCKTYQKLEIFGNFVASRSAGPFVGRHFLLERHFAEKMISVGKAWRCPFNILAKRRNASANANRRVSDENLGDRRSEQVLDQERDHIKLRLRAEGMERGGGGG